MYNTAMRNNSNRIIKNDTVLLCKNSLRRSFGVISSMLYMLQFVRIISSVFNFTCFVIVIVVVIVVIVIVAHLSSLTSAQYYFHHSPCVSFPKNILEITAFKVR